MANEVVKRQQWSGKLDFILSSLSIAVGLGNIWRFPYICYEHGGAVFLIPYVIMLLLLGLPLYFMELSLGQFCARGTIETWKQSIPLFKGLGYSSVINVFYVGTFYMVIVSWAMFYLAMSFRKLLPWTRCQLGYDDWSDEHCFSKLDNMYCTSLNSSTNFYFDGECVNATNEEIISIRNASSSTFPSEQYFYNHVMRISSDMYSLGKFNWQLSVCLIGVWTLVYLSLMKGTKSMGKIAHVTALFPYVALTSLLIRGATLPGAEKGVYFYLVPKLEKLLKPQVWYDAASQILFSLNCCVGATITISSFNPFKNNCQRDALIVTVSNCLTSFFAGFAVFTIMGFIANELGVEVDSVVKQGEALAFIAYPQAVARMDIAPLWSFIFFFMILLLGIGSMFGIVPIILTAIEDNWPQLVKKKWLVLIALCSVMCCCGFALVSEGGIYAFVIIVTQTANALVLCGIFEVFGISYIYGIKRFSKDIQLMTGIKINYYWKFTWLVSAPLFTLAIVIYSWIKYESPSYNGKLLPPWLLALSWIIYASILLPIPILAIHELHKNNWSLKKSIQPSDVWGPSEAEPKIRKLYIMNDDRKFFNDSIDAPASIRSVPSQEAMEMHKF